MHRKHTYYNLNKKIDQIISAIDLNYILAEARREEYSVSLTCGDFVNNVSLVSKKQIKWYNNKCNLSYNYELSTGIMYQFISTHEDKIIKINISSVDNIYPLNRNIIIYVPFKKYLSRIKKEYSSVVDLF